MNLHFILLYQSQQYLINRLLSLVMYSLTLIVVRLKVIGHNEPFLTPITVLARRLITQVLGSFFFFVTIKLLLAPSDPSFIFIF